MRKVLSVFIAACLVLSLFTGIFVSMTSARADTTYAVTFGVTGANGTLRATVASVAIATGALVAGGKDVVFTAVPATGYQVKAWTVDGNVAVVGNGTELTVPGLAAAIAVTVEFEAISSTTYTVTFDTQGGLIAIGPETGIVSGAFAILPPNPTKDGFTFAGWFTATTGGTAFTAATAVTADVTVYAQWTVTYIPAPVKKQTVLVLHIGKSMFTVNGASKTLDSPPIIKNSRTLLPIRAIIEALGGTIAWNAVARKVTVTLGTKTLQLWIGKSVATVNGVSTSIDSTNAKVVPEIINGRTMLPLRFVSENLGTTVGWDQNTQTITISDGDAVVTVPKNLSQIAWMHSGTGWGWAWSTNGHILQTLNGGASWKETPTPDMAGRSIVASSFPDGSTAFLATRAGGADLHSDIVVYRTSDKGLTWHSAPVVMKLGYEGEEGGSFSMDFADASHGFLMSTSGPAAGLMGKALYRTVDGGKTFSLVGDIEMGGVNGYPTGMAFSTPQTGFVTCEDHGQSAIPMFKTTDGGTTWHPAPLPAPSVCKDLIYQDGYYGSAYPPVFFGEQKKDGVALVIFLLHNGNNVTQFSQFYRTSNGGSTWTLGPVSQQRVIPSCFSDYTTGWGVAEIGGGMFKTADGGATWNPVTMAN